MTFPKLRRTAALALCAATTILGLTGCGGVPTKAEFVEKVTKSTLKDAKSSFTDAGLTDAQATEVIKVYATCAYDRLSEDESKLQQAYDTENGIAALLETAAPECADKMSAALNKAMLEAANK
jgi:hypothetical protein